MIRIYDHAHWITMPRNEQNLPYFDSNESFLASSEQHPVANYLALDLDSIAKLDATNDRYKTAIFVLSSSAAIPCYDYRRGIYTLTQKGFSQPILVSVANCDSDAFYQDAELETHLQVNAESKTQLSVSSVLSSLLVDGLLDGVWIQAADSTLLRTVFGGLQMSRMRITKTEYISCPSCGRTLFDLQETTAKIRSRTEHLKGVKIGIMGCIVNGPGEMADADYGYVGVGVDKISLYRGKDVVMKAVKTNEAVDKLIDLIREDGRWVEQSVQV
jgi:(E)-4-hydroxy-3-methylbut-2-enyl-diphosphate synthase